MARQDRVFNLDDIWDLGLGIDRFESGSWFFLKNTVIAELSGDATWDQGDGKGHPCVLQIASGPTGFVNPRSSTSPDGSVLHDPHEPDHDPHCRLDRLGYVKIKGFSITNDMLEGKRRCVEPGTSTLLDQLKQQARRKR